MNHFILLYKQKWYVPPQVVIGAFILAQFTVSFHSEILFYFSLLLPLAAIVLSIVLSGRRLFKKEYVWGTLQLLSTVLITGLAYVPLSMFFLFYPYDFYANNLSIPSEITVHTPINLEVQEENTSNHSQNLDFQLYGSLQGGLYHYEFTYQAPSKGILYLKAFEVTHNDPLSVPSLEQRSRIKIDTLLNAPIRYKKEDHFTIYEGDWGDEYAARFEVWFLPADKAKAIKLTEKVYRIEGWQR